MVVDGSRLLLTGLTVCHAVFVLLYLFHWRLAALFLCVDRPQAAVPAPAVPATAVGPPVVVATVVGSGNDNAQSGAV